MLRRFAFAALLVLLPASAFAQMPISVGGFIGDHLDNSEDWIIFGGEARVEFADQGFELNPRFTYRPLDGGSLTQFDVNLLKNLELAKPGRFRPFVGVGGAFTRVSFDSFSESKAGINLVSGSRIVLNGDSPLEPFFNAQYTITNDFENVFALVVGASFKIR